MIVSCTGNASSLVNLDESGAALAWGKPMPNFTNNEMQNELAPRLAASLARARLLPGNLDIGFDELTWYFGASG